ncbi:MAG TPA: hypothetical protein VH369_07510 [Bryobacteraceae bacterium]
MKMIKGIDPLPDLGNLIFAIALLFSTLIVLIECLQRRRDSERERRLLDTIEREYWAYRRLGRL